MNNLFFLTEDDFYITNSKADNREILACNYQGYCMILFHVNEDRCSHCGEAIPEFKAVARRFGSCGFGMCNLSKFPGVISMSKRTKLPFKYVPYILFYADGVPFARYEGGLNAIEISDFLKEIISILQPKRNFIEQKKYKLEGDMKPIVPGAGIPYNLVCDDDKGICYLKASDAHKDNSISRTDSIPR